MVSLLRARLTILRACRIDELNKARQEIIDCYRKKAQDRIKEIDHCIRMVQEKLAKEYGIFIS